MSGIKRYLPDFIKIAFMKLHCRFILVKLKLRRSAKPRCFVFMTPQFGNIGDQAIAQAQYEFLCDNLPDYQMIEIPFRYFIHSKKQMIQEIAPEDMIVLHGGGNIGTLWPAFEYERLEIIKAFPDNKIISFPQSVFFGDGNAATDELNKSAGTYASHKKLHVFARERYSCERLVKMQLRNVYLVPDIVLYMDHTEPSYNRQGALMCFRDDKEKNISSALIKQIERHVKKYTDQVIYTDTVVEKRIPISQRSRVINMKLEQFKRAKLVLTDRLHGLIFAAITETPCLAFGNSYYKIKGIYEWVKHLSYIKFCEDESEIESHIHNLWGLDNCNYDNSPFVSKFDMIREVLKGD